jgi:photosystem II stability/assembly factor-like uncharacterized protein
MPPHLQEEAALPWLPTTAPSRQRYDDVWSFDEDVVVTINSSGEILKTANAGAVWEKKFQTPLIPPSNRAVYLRCLAFADKSDGWAGTLTREHRLFRTLDGGETWAPSGPLPAGAPVKICGLFAASRTVIYGSGTNDPSDGAAIIKSSDGGEKWQAIDMSAHAASLIDIYFTSESHGFVVGGVSQDPAPNYDNVRPVILETSDGGRTWIDRLAGMRSEFVDGTWGWKIHFVTASVGYVSLENFTRALILKTQDGGATWKKIDIGENANLEGVGFLDEATGWVGGWGDESFSSGTTSATVDGGQSWANADDIGRFINRFRSPPRFGYASGRSVYRFSSGPATALQPVGPVRTLIRSPEDRVYGGPEVSIEINVPSGTRQISVQLWDRFGREIGVLLNESSPSAGPRTLTWNRKDDRGNPVRHGIYIYRVTMDDHAESQVISLR